MAEPNDPKTQAHYEEVNAGQGAAPKTLKEMTPEQQRSLRKDVRRAHKHLADPDYRAPKKVLAAVNDHPYPAIFLSLYQKLCDETPLQTYGRAREERRRKAGRSGPVHQPAPTTTPIQDAPSQEAAPSRVGAPPGDGMDVAWRKFNAFIMKEMKLDPSQDFHSRLFDELSPGFRQVAWQLVRGAVAGDKFVATQAGITLDQSAAAGRAMWDRELSISQFDPNNPEQRGKSSPRTLVRLEAARDESLIAAGLKQPPPEVSGQDLDRVKPKMPPARLHLTAEWKSFHTTLNRLTNRTNLKDRAITATEFGSEQFGAVNRQRLVNIITGALKKQPDVLFPALDAATRKKIAQVMLKQIPDLKRLCR